MFLLLHNGALLCVHLSYNIPAKPTSKQLEILSICVFCVFFEKQTKLLRPKHPLCVSFFLYFILFQPVINNTTNSFDLSQKSKIKVVYRDDPLII